VPREAAVQRAEVAHRGGVERVADLRAATLGRDQPSLAQHLQMLAHGRLADPEDVREVARARRRLGREPLRDPEAHGVPEGLQAGGVAARLVHRPRHSIVIL
jgi:hypothetical protein